MYSLPEKCSKGSGGTKDWYVFAKQSNLIISLPKGQNDVQLNDVQLYVRGKTIWISLVYE